jgi:hypothetical protein
VNFKTVFFWLTLPYVSLNSVFAQANQGEVSSGQAAPTSQVLSVPAKSSSLQRLSVSSYPEEAELRIGVGEPSFFGLTRGFVLGSHLFENMLSTLLGQHVFSSGTWIEYDGLVGYQFLNGVESRYFATAHVGYSGYSLKRTDVGSGEQKVSSSGAVFQVNYSQIISPVFTLGVQVQGNFIQDKFTGDINDFLRQSNEGTNTRRQLRDFYEHTASRRPKVRASFPMELEVINWKASHIDFPNHLRGYVFIEPFYRQLEFKIDKAFESVEKNFGVKIGPKLTYESPNEKSGRYALGVDFGVEVGFGKLQTSFEDEANPQVELFSLPKQKILSIYSNVMFSYKF